MSKAKSTKDLKDLEILPRFPLLTSKQKEDKNKINSFTRSVQFKKLYESLVQIWKYSLVSEVRGPSLKLR